MEQVGGSPTPRRTGDPAWRTDRIPGIFTPRIYPVVADCSLAREVRGGQKSLSADGIRVENHGVTVARSSLEQRRSDAFLAGRWRSGTSTTLGERSGAGRAAGFSSGAGTTERCGRSPAACRIPTGPCIAPTYPPGGTGKGHAAVDPCAGNVALADAGVSDASAAARSVVSAGAGRASGGTSRLHPSLCGRRNLHGCIALPAQRTGAPGGQSPVSGDPVACV